MKPLLLARNLQLGSAQRPRLIDIDLQLAPGDRLALLGVNGAGKSSLLAVLAGILAPSDGEVLVQGERLDRAGQGLRRQIGYLPQRVPSYPELTVVENLRWAGQLRGLRHGALTEAIERVLGQLELASVADRLAGRLSTGMAQRLGLAQAVLHRPSILILDEPTAGLDPLQTEQIRGLLSGISDHGGLILATHLLDDVQRLCNRVILIEEGRKKAEQAVTADIDLLAHFRAPAAATT